MDAPQVADVLGTLATFAVLVVVGLGVLRVLAPATFSWVRGAATGTGALLAGGVAIVATLGSLWFSEAAHFTPCELCWYQRIAMYPLAVLLPLGAWRGDGSVRLYAFVMAGMGITISAWHNLIETFPDVSSSGCDPNNPCTLRWVEGLGFWTIPRMAFAAFALVIALLALDRPLREAP
ncbi:MAG TPA: disulfide bond formation protein B [Acidimicrobiales bacterium]|nr:disulfide bond formation protein B [Acidimicrobiales bacterium]